ncbi:LPS-assembly protein LptD [Oceaniglobus roseus]|uniref:LPS-assembly protein LptD n=1 Tax=Oceaniglobus roseus TaxID=1737570 RepID=UPI000C7EB2AD|nr:LPS assembly protein LptD [Kandeliimicrobium roseum]
MRRLLVLLLMTTALAAPTLPTRAQTQGQAQATEQAGPQTATLVADRVRVSRTEELVAEGDVEVLYGTTRLKARRVIYAKAGERLKIEGPITVTDRDGAIIVVADQAELDRDLQNGILVSARLVLEQQLQLAANEIAFVDGRYTQLSRSVASSCEVCPSNPRPTWEIRARRIIHDRQERQIYFDHAQFRFLGIPIFYSPRLRLPDPTLTRATGFLLPSVRSTSLLSTGLKLPYFIRLGDSADLTLTPYVSSRTRTLQAEYRQAFRTGTISFEGAISKDDLGVEDPRYYLFGEGDFVLPRDFRLEFDLQLVSDTAYLLDYGYSDRDRLASEVKISRARRRDLFIASVTDFRTLRESEIPIRDQLPGTYAYVNYERRLFPLGGEMRLGIDAASLVRASRLDGVGRDVSRIGLSADFRRSVELPLGIVATGMLGFAADSYDTRQDSAFDTTTGRVTRQASLELRWPFHKTEASGAYQVLEPIVQVAWADTNGSAVPNEDSVLVEFDEGNLFAISRYPGIDAREQGTRTNVGLSWTRFDPAGWSIGTTVGRVYRASDLGQFSAGSGLSGARSDWLAALQLRIGNSFALTQRSLFDDQFDFSRSEARLAWQNARTAIGASYLWLKADAAENRPDPLHEIALDTRRRLSRHWTGSFNSRYDLVNDQAAEAGLGLQYRSECLTVDLSLSRRFTSSTSVEPSTDFGVNVSLAGFGSGRNDESYRRSCAR